MNEGRFHNDTATEYRLFQLAAPHYDDAQHSIAKALQQQIHASTENIFSVLEIGCGTGITSEVILKTDPRIKLVTIDNEEMMVHQAQQALHTYEKQGRVEVQLVDALDYLQGSPRDSFDAVCTALTLHNCTNEYRKLVYIQILRTLKNGGVYITMDKTAAENEAEHQRELAWQVKQFSIFTKVGHPDLKKKWEDHYADDEKPELILREQDLLHDLREVGFRNITKTFRQHMEATFVAKK